MDTTPAAPSKQLVRTREGRLLAGVCSGAGEFLGVDANIVRLALLVFTCLGGSGVLVYAAAWLIIPEEGKAVSILQELINKQQQRTQQKTH